MLSKRVQRQFDLVTQHLYINPLEKCNLRCQICYTRKTNPILSHDAMLGFIDRYEKTVKLQTITFCGGEVFALANFPELVNTLTSRGKFVQMVTNGTLDRLVEFTHPNQIQLIVSLDGLEQYHDANRGAGNFAKSIAFLQHGKQMGFHLHIFSIVTRQNFPAISTFEQYLQNTISPDIEVTYHPRKPPAYLTHHPVSNVIGEVKGFDFLTGTEMINVMKNRKTFPPKELGCFQIALASDGSVYGCCEGVTPLGRIDSSIEELFAALQKRLVEWEKTITWQGCLGCSQPDFVCGIRSYLETMYAE